MKFDEETRFVKIRSLALSSSSLAGPGAHEMPPALFYPKSILIKNFRNLNARGRPANRYQYAPS
jgi:hypothetical protein